MLLFLILCILKIYFFRRIKKTIQTPKNVFRSIFKMQSSIEKQIVFLKIFYIETNAALGFVWIPFIAENWKFIAENWKLIAENIITK